MSYQNNDVGHRAPQHFAVTSGDYNNGAEYRLNNGAHRNYSDGTQQGYGGDTRNGYGDSQRNGHDTSGMQNSSRADAHDGYSNGVQHNHGLAPHDESRNGQHNTNSHTYSGAPIEVICGPLLNYQHMSAEVGGKTWQGSVLIVTKPGQNQPQLELKCLGSSQAGTSNEGRGQTVDGLKLYSDPVKEFWRFTVVAQMESTETKWQYTIPNVKFLNEVHPEPVRHFFIPAFTESMRIMFHSCNGFSVGTDEDYWSGTYSSTSVCDVVLMLYRTCTLERCVAHSRETTIPRYDWRRRPNLQ